VIVKVSPPVRVSPPSGSVKERVGVAPMAGTLVRRRSATRTTAPA
jgi:hypothetical protein